jgi:hypothetical protein
MRGCPGTVAILKDIGRATKEDWSAEYLDLTLAIRVVADMNEAIDHIRKYGSSHTEAIITANYDRAWRFLREVNSSLVLVNASTRLNDGFQLGLGAEMGISTTRLHAFGPMGLEELTVTNSSPLVMGNCGRRDGTMATGVFGGTFTRCIWGICASPRRSGRIFTWTASISSPPTSLPTRKPRAGSPASA